MDNIRTQTSVEDGKLNKSPTPFVHRNDEEKDDEEDYDADYLDDEPRRKPKGKKIRKMRSNFDR